MSSKKHKFFSLVLVAIFIFSATPTKASALINPNPFKGFSVGVMCVGVLMIVGAAVMNTDIPDNPVAFRSRAQFEKAVLSAKHFKKIQPHVGWAGVGILGAGFLTLVLSERSLNRR